MTAAAQPRAAARRRRRVTATSWLAPTLVIVALIAVWELIVDAGWVDPLLLPAPRSVARALWTDRSVLGPDLATTTWEVLIGLAVSLALGVAVGVLMHMRRTAERTLRPLVIGSQAVPILVIAPLIVLVLGFGLAPKVLIVALVCFFPVAINVYDGLRDTDPTARKLLRSLDASRWQALWLLEAPSALPAAFTGAKVAAAVAVTGAVFGEWSGSDSGLGHLVINANFQLATATQFAATVLLIVEAIVLYVAFAALERRVVSWTPRAAR